MRRGRKLINNFWSLIFSGRCNITIFEAFDVRFYQVFLVFQMELCHCSIFVIWHPMKQNLLEVFCIIWCDLQINVKMQILSISQVQTSAFCERCSWAGADQREQRLALAWRSLALHRVGHVKTQRADKVQANKMRHQATRGAPTLRASGVHWVWMWSCWNRLLLGGVSLAIFSFGRWGGQVYKPASAEERVES